MPAPSSLKAPRVLAALAEAVVPFPAAGALRVHANPDRVHRPTPSKTGVRPQPGPNRFDDPHHHYPVRYLAEHLHVCLLEVMARLRAHPGAEEVLAQMGNGAEEEELVGLPDPDQVSGVGKFLETSPVSTIVLAPTVPPESLVNIFDGDLLAALAGVHSVRKLLGRPEIVKCYGDANGVVDVDGSLVRNPSTVVGRPVTQEISRLLLDLTPVMGLRYISRHDDGEDAYCWALHGDLPVRISSPVQLTPHNESHRAAVQFVAARYQLPLPDDWRQRTAALTGGDPLVGIS